MGAINPATMHAAHDRLYRAVRSADPDHLIIIEDGYKGAATFPLPSAAGWSNVAYSLHVYGFASKTPADQLAKLAWIREEGEKVEIDCGVPVYIGEFNQEPCGTRETMTAFVQEMEAHAWAYTIWTYKIMKPPGTSSMWGNFRNPKPVTPINPFTDSEAEMLAKMPAFRTENLEREERLFGVIGKVGR
jgi:hypothetical protein